MRFAAAPSIPPGAGYSGVKLSQNAETFRKNDDVVSLDFIDADNQCERTNGVPIEAFNEVRDAYGLETHELNVPVSNKYDLLSTGTSTNQYTQEISDLPYSGDVSGTALHGNPENPADTGQGFSSDFEELEMMQLGSNLDVDLTHVESLLRQDHALSDVANIPHCDGAALRDTALQNFDLIDYTDQPEPVLNGNSSDVTRTFATEQTLKTLGRESLERSQLGGEEDSNENPLGNAKAVQPLTLNDNDQRYENPQWIVGHGPLTSLMMPDAADTQTAGPSVLKDIVRPETAVENVDALQALSALDTQVNHLSDLQLHRGLPLGWDSRNMVDILHNEHLTMHLTNQLSVDGFNKDGYVHDYYYQNPVPESSELYSLQGILNEPMHIGGRQFMGPDLRVSNTNTPTTMQQFIAQMPNADGQRFFSHVQPSMGSLSSIGRQQSCDFRDAIGRPFNAYANQQSFPLMLDIPGAPSGPGFGNWFAANSNPSLPQIPVRPSDFCVSQGSHQLHELNRTEISAPMNSGDFGTLSTVAPQVPVIGYKSSCGKRKKSTKTTRSPNEDDSDSDRDIDPPEKDDSRAPPESASSDHSRRFLDLDKSISYNRIFTGDQNVDEFRMEVRKKTANASVLPVLESPKPKTIRSRKSKGNSDPKERSLQRRKQFLPYILRSVPGVIAWNNVVDRIIKEAKKLNTAEDATAQNNGVFEKLENGEENTVNIAADSKTQSASDSPSSSSTDLQVYPECLPVKRSASESFGDDIRKRQRTDDNFHRTKRFEDVSTLTESEDDSEDMTWEPESIRTHWVKMRPIDDNDDTPAQVLKCDYELIPVSSTESQELNDRSVRNGEQNGEHVGPDDGHDGGQEGDHGDSEHHGRQNVDLPDGKSNNKNLPRTCPFWQCSTPYDRLTLKELRNHISSHLQAQVCNLCGHSYSRKDSAARHSDNTHDVVFLNEQTNYWMRVAMRQVKRVPGANRLGERAMEILREEREKLDLQLKLYLMWPRNSAVTFNVMTSSGPNKSPATNKKVGWRLSVSLDDAVDRTNNTKTKRSKKGVK